MKSILSIAIFVVLILSSANLNAESYVVKFSAGYAATLAGSDLIQSGNIKSIFPQFSKASKTDRTQAANELTKYYLVEENLLQSLVASLPEGSVEDISPNYIYKIEKSPLSDDLIDKQWAIKAIDAPAAWELATGKGVTIGLVDTGIDYNHPDLVANLWINPAEDLNGNGRLDPWSHEIEINGVSGDFNFIDDDGNGIIDDVIGYDFVDQTFMNYGDSRQPDGDPFDEGEHGTAVAGVMAATADNDIGIAGLAYNARIMTARAFDATGNGESDDIAAAIVYCVANGAKVLNFSFGEKFMSPIVYDAIKYAYERGVIMFASSGNSNNSDPHYPSDHPEVVCVGASNSKGDKYGFGNYGSMLDITAPGSDIMTTVAGGIYDKSSGTSLASPYASAVAALMLEHEPNLSTAEIKGTIMASAVDAGANGWDVRFGAGLLNAKNALTTVGKTIIEIVEPAHDAAFNKSKTANVDITATTLAPLFDKVTVLIGEGHLPEKFDTIAANIDSQFFDEKLATLDISALKDTLYTISLSVRLKNLKTLEKRVIIEVFSDSNPLAFESVDYKKAYYRGKQNTLFQIVTNKAADAYVIVEDESGEIISIIREFQKRSTYNLLLIDNIDKQQTYTATAFAYLDNDTISKSFNINTFDAEFPVSTFTPKAYTLPRAYISNDAADLYGSGKPSIGISNLSTLVIGKPEIYEFSDTTFIKKDELDEINIPIGFGDSNGDGVPEVLLSASFASNLYQREAVGQSVFANKLYASRSENTRWAEHFIDMDGDGHDEIIARGDSGYVMIKNIDGKYLVSAKANLPADYQAYGLDGGSAVGDFDGDGSQDLAFVNRLGTLFIYKYNGSDFIIDKVVDERRASSNQHLTAFDMDGDGIDEIAHAFTAAAGLPQGVKSDESIWNLNIYSYKNNDFTRLENIYFYDTREGYIPRLGFSYRNGITSGELNNKPGDELIVSFFPNLYIFAGGSDSLSPLWHYPAALSNSAVVYDFDKNGISEVGFSSFSEMLFFEYDEQENSLPEPMNVRGWALDETDAYLSWRSVSTSSHTIVSIIYEAEGELLAVPIDTVASDEIYMTGFEPHRYYNFAVQAFDSVSSGISGFSRAVRIYMNSRAAISDYSDGVNSQISLRYSGRMPANNVEAGKFAINYQGKRVYATSALTACDSTLVVSFQGEIETGEYIFYADSFADLYGNPTYADTLEVNFIEVPVEDELRLAKLEFLDFALVKLFFSHKIDPLSSSNIENYEIKPFGEIINISYDDVDSNAVLMNLSYVLARGGARGRDYTLTARNVFTADSSLEITRGAGNTLGFTIASTGIDDTYVYPNPISLSSDEDIYFANLTPRAKIDIYTLDGEHLRTLLEQNSNGGVEWDARDSKGNLLQPGVYIYKASALNLAGESLEEQWSKFMIQP